MEHRIIEHIRARVALDEPKGRPLANERDMGRLTVVLSEALARFEIASANMHRIKSCHGRKYKDSQIRFQESAICFYKAVGNYLYFVPEPFRQGLEIGEFRERLARAERVFDDMFYYVGL